MLSFENDYNTGAHPLVLKKLVETNFNFESGYGTDSYTQSAIDKIRKKCNCPDAEIYFAVGGTQTNQLIISTLLKDYEGVVSAETGHIASHEAGAIEHSGRKVLTLTSHNGKIDGDELKIFLETFYGDANHEHMVFPGMVYISHPTEYGSLYSKSELEKIYSVCKSYEIPLFMDGARLAYGLTSTESDLSLEDIAKLTDVFYIGGTKCGALCGEAIVFTKSNMPKHFVTLAKQRGALLAKGRLIGVQFDALFTDDLYFRNGENAIRQKDKLVEVLKNAGLEFFYESPTNQQFVIIENSKLEKLQKEVAVSFWEKYDDTKSVIRFATSWSTTNEDIEKLKEIL